MTRGGAGAVSPGLGVPILGNSVFEGVGTALLIPPVHILATLAFTDVTSRARAFGLISGAGGIGAAAGPLIGGVITTGISWRAAFIFQALIIVAIVLLSRRLEDPLPPDPRRRFDVVGAIVSAVGMFFLVFGILQAQTDAVRRSASWSRRSRSNVWPVGTSSGRSSAPASSSPSPASGS
jgi:MFS family permease